MNVFVAVEAFYLFSCRIADPPGVADRAASPTGGSSSA